MDQSNKGFSVDKAAVGAVLLGPVGLWVEPWERRRLPITIAAIAVFETTISQRTRSTTMGKRILAVIVALVLFLGIGGCVSTCSDSGSSSSSSSSSSKSSSSSLSKDEQQRRAVEDEASHYYYDKNGHIHDDRK
mgnify:CR=1 FL=1